MDLRVDNTLAISGNKYGANSNSNGTNYVNSIVKVGNELKTNSENLILLGGNL